MGFVDARTHFVHCTKYKHQVYVLRMLFVSISYVRCDLQVNRVHGDLAFLMGKFGVMLA